MIFIYFRIAFRNLMGQKVYSTINIIGLAISISICALIAIYVSHELSYDSFHMNNHRIYKLGKHNTPAPFAELAKENIPEVEKAVRLDLNTYSDLTVRNGENIITIKRVMYADSGFLKVFTFPLKSGNINDALNDPISIILTEKYARILFGNSDPVGKTVTLENSMDFKVSGVIAEVPDNSSIEFDCILPLDFLKVRAGKERWERRNWQNWNYQTFFLLFPNTDMALIETKINSLLKDNYPKERGTLKDYYPLYAFSDLYFNTDASGGTKKGNITAIYSFITIGTLILLIALFNFINLSTARTFKKNKEIGIRKLTGASRMALIQQMITEAILYSFIACTLALVIISLVLPVYNDLIGFVFFIESFNVVLTFATILIVSVVVGILAGLYPALYLSTFKPQNAVRGGISNNLQKSFIRKALVIVQFTASSILIIFAITIYHQMDYIKSKPLGFNKENIIYFELNNELYEKKDLLKEKLLRNPAILEMSYANSLPGDMAASWGQDFNDNGEIKKVSYHVSFVDPDFVEIMDMQLVEGRNFLQGNSTDTSNAIVNEDFLNKYNIINPLGKRFSVFGEDKAYIVGVVKDFNFMSLRQEISPLVFFNQPGWAGKGIIKFSYSDYSSIKNVIEYLSLTWKEYSPNFPFDYTFLDASLEKQYNKEMRYGKTILYFSVLAIFIASLGLLGLVTFYAEQRTKEIGIRKTLGATIADIIKLLTGEFIVLVTIAALIACPIGYYIASTWLNDYAYKFSLNIGIFLSAGVITLVVAILTICYQVIKAASANPVESLKYE